MRVFSLIKDLWWMLIPLVLCIVGVFIKVLLPYGFGITLVVLILWMIRMNSEAKKVVPIPIKFPRILWFFLFTSLLLLLIFPQFSLKFPLKFPFSKFFFSLLLPVYLGPFILVAVLILIYAFFKSYSYYLSRKIDAARMLIETGAILRKTAPEQQDFSHFHIRQIQRKDRLSFFNTLIMPPLLWALLASLVVLILIDMFAPKLWGSPFTLATLLILTIALTASIMVFIFLYKTLPKYKPKIPAFQIGGVSAICLSIVSFLAALRGLYQHYPDFKYLAFSGMILAGISVFSMMLMVLSSLKPEESTKKAIYCCSAIGASSLIGSIIIFVAGELVGILLQDILVLKPALF